MSKSNRLEIVPPGALLLEEFIQPSGLTQRQVAKALHMPASRLSELIHGRLRITADLALRLGRLWSTSPQMWMNLQSDYDLRLASSDHKARALLRKVEPIHQAA